VDQEKSRLDELETETKTHIVQCEERWKTNFNRMDDIDENLERIEARTIAFGAGIIIFLAGLVVTLLTTG